MRIYDDACRQEISAGIGVRDKVISLAHFGGIQPDTQYPIASASKFLTAATVMAVVDDGRLQLDAPISTWLPKLPPAAGKLTLRQLLSQASGLAGSNKRSAFHRLFNNQWLWGALGLSLALHVAVIYVPFLQNAFSTAN